MAGKKQTTPVIKPFCNDPTRIVKVFDPKTSSCVAAKNINGKIHVFVANTREVIVRCPEIPRTFELQKTHDDQWHIWVATFPGSIYRKSLTFSHCSNAESMDVDEVDGGSSAIFEDLLGETEPTCHNIRIPNRKATENICDINENDKVFSDCGDVASMCCGENCLILLCSEKNETFLQIYHMSKLLSEKTSQDAQKFSLPFCRLGGMHQTPKMHVVVPTCNSLSCISSSQFSVPSHLFSSVFGWESSVRELPALLCSLSNGSVYFRPVDLTVSDLTPAWQLLCVVDSPVRDILPVRVNRTLTERESIAAELQKGLGLTTVVPSKSMLEAVVVVGASGKCCLMTAVPMLGSVRSDYQNITTVFTLPGSVQCVCTWDQTMFISSGNCVYKCSLTLRRKDGESDWRQLSVDLHSEELFSATVSSMWISGSGDSIVCETANGDLVEFDTTVKASDDNIGEHHQPSLKDLLLSVDVNQEKLNELKTRQKKHNSFLQQLNIASHLLHFHHPEAAAPQQTVPTNSSKISAHSAPVSTKITVQSEVGYHAVNYYLVVTVTNCCSLALTQDWSLVVTLCAADSAQSSDTQTFAAPKSSPSSHTFQLSRGLGPEQSVVFKVPVLYSPSCPRLTVLTSLVLHAAVPLQTGRKELEALPRGLVIPTAKAVVDLFHFLHLRQPGCVLPQAADPVTSIQEIVSMPNCSSSSCNKTDTGRKQYQSYTISENVEVMSTSPVDILHKLLNDSQSHMDLVTTPTCVLQVPCGSSLSVSVEPIPEQITARGEAQSFVVTIKSCNISLLARARLALQRRIQMQSMARKQGSTKGEEVHALMSRSEVLLQQLHGIQHKATCSTSSADDLAQLYSLYETMRAGTLSL